MDKQKLNHEKVYRLIQTIAVICMFASVALAIMMSFQVIKYTPAILAIVLVILVISVSCMMVLPWVKQLAKGEFKVLCYVMFAIAAISCVLWTADVIVAVNLATMINKDVADAVIFGQLKFIKISLIITFQLIVVSLIASFVVKYRKTMIAFQVITYISNLYIDFYGSYALTCVVSTNDGLQFVGNTNFITNKISIMFAVMALAFVTISNAVVRSMDKRKRRDALAPMFDSQDKQITQTSTQSNSDVNDGKTVQQKLKELKNLLDNNLITEEEYAKKRDELIDQL